jgi:hypothetical protein
VWNDAQQEALHLPQRYHPQVNQGTDLETRNSQGIAIDDELESLGRRQSRHAWNDAQREALLLLQTHHPQANQETNLETRNSQEIAIDDGRGRLGEMKLVDSE